MHLLKKFGLKKFSHLIEQPSAKMLPVVNKILPYIIPFNQPHKISIISISKNEVKASLPFSTKNKNHISTLHACAIATLGEFTAGILLLQHFPIVKFRMILKKLDSKYHYQGKTQLNSITKSPDNLKQSINTIQISGVGYISLKTDLFDKGNNLVATVLSTWQIKKWEKTHTS